jgi:hypothetical protein
MMLKVCLALILFAAAAFTVWALDHFDELNDDAETLDDY